MSHINPIHSRPYSNEGRNNYDRIFRSKAPEAAKSPSMEEVVEKMAPDHRAEFLENVRKHQDQSG